VWTVVQCLVNRGSVDECHESESSGPFRDRILHYHCVLNSTILPEILLQLFWGKGKRMVVRSDLQVVLQVSVLTVIR
jgi:hypothetical protein